VVDQQAVDAHLVAVLNQVLEAVYQAKQASWSATGSPASVDLQDLVAFLIDQSGRLMVAEANIDGRSPDVASPSSYQRGNLAGEAENDLETTLALLSDRLQAIVDDTRRRADGIAEATEAAILTELAEGLEARIDRLQTG
jgi:hypothetical protein